MTLKDARIWGTQRQVQAAMGAAAQENRVQILTAAPPLSSGLDIGQQQEIMDQVLQKQVSLETVACPPLAGPLK